jgi:hypothetical protein
MFRLLNKMSKNEERRSMTRDPVTTTPYSERNETKLMRII